MVAEVETPRKVHYDQAERHYEDQTKFGHKHLQISE
jgi:hypothetical protein